MNVAYSEKTKCTITAIREYDDMRMIFVKTPAAIKRKHAALTKPQTSRLDGASHTYNPQANEDRIINTLDLIGEMDKRYTQAVVFLQWFEPAWLSLNKSEKQILGTYKSSNIRSKTIEDIANETSYSTRQLRRTRQKALVHLESLLYEK